MVKILNIFLCFVKFLYQIFLYCYYRYLNNQKKYTSNFSIDQIVDSFNYQKSGCFFCIAALVKCTNRLDSSSTDSKSIKIREKKKQDFHIYLLQLIYRDYIQSQIIEDIHDEKKRSMVLYMQSIHSISYRTSFHSIIMDFRYIFE